MYGTNIGTLVLQENTTGTWVTLWTESGNQGTAWFKNTTDLSSLTGTANLRFFYTCAGGYRGDVAIDSIHIYSDRVANDSDVNCTWSGLSESTTYTWYVNTSDRDNISTSSIWTLTTLSSDTTKPDITWVEPPRPGDGDTIYQDWVDM